MHFPTDRKYSRTHEWVQSIDANTALVGISDFAQSELGDIVFVGLPTVGDAVVKETTLCEVESVKAVSEVFSPVTGTVAETNAALEDAPEKLNEDCYGAWICKVEGITDTEELMTAEAYEAFCKEA